VLVSCPKLEASFGQETKRGKGLAVIGDVYCTYRLSGQVAFVSAGADESNSTAQQAK